MFDIRRGKVGVFCDYGTPDEKKLTELRDGQFFGEMGLLCKAPRSATVVALEDDTQLIKIGETGFESFLAENPAKAFQIMQQLSERLRDTTDKYVDACRTVYEVVETEKAGKKRSDSLSERVMELFELYRGHVVLISGGSALGHLLQAAAHRAPSRARKARCFACLPCS